MTGAAPAPLDFYFDFGSPYGYFAGLRIDGLAAAHGRTVVWRPILLGPILAVTGSRPNTDIPLRSDYMRRDVHRIARLLGCPFAWPESAPLKSVVPSRAVWWVREGDPELAHRLARALHHAHWGEGRDITGIEAVGAVAAPLGIDPAALADGVAQPRIKDRLRAETEGAIARGVFGAPYIIADGEPFWGWDRLDMLDRWLARGGW